MIYALCLVIAWLMLAIVVLANHLAKYKSAFRDVATQLYNVTADRNRLSIQNEGLKRELARECVALEKARDKLKSVCAHKLVSRGEECFATCEECGTIVSYDVVTSNWK